MIRTEKIKSSQLLIMMFITKIFFLMMYTPKITKSIESMSYMIGQIIAIPIIFITLIPFFYLNKKLRGYNIVACAEKVNKPFGKIVGWLYAAYLLFSAINTVINFDFFLTTSIYPDSKSEPFIIIFVLVCLYCAMLGIEPLARFSGFVMFALAVSGFLIFIPLLSDINISFLHLPVHATVSDFSQVIYASVILNNDFVLLYIFSDSINGNMNKGVSKYVIWGVFFYELIAFFTVVIFGPYGKTILFPLYSLSAISHTSILERTDSIHVIIWVFIAFVKTALYLIASSKIMAQLVKVKYDKLALINAVITAVLVVILSKSFTVLHNISIFTYTGVLFFAFIIAIPIIVSILVKYKTRRGAN